VLQWSGQVRTMRAAAVQLLVLLALVAVPTQGRADPGAAAPIGAAPLQGAALGIRSGLSVTLVEAATGQALVSTAADVRRAVASTVKLVTALAVVDALPAGSNVRIGDGVTGVEGASYGLRPGEVRTVEDLLAGLLLRSGNDVAVALAEAIDGSEEAFIDRMEAVLLGLGIEARPVSSSGLAEGDMLSAQELATVARAALAEPRIRDLVALRSLRRDDGLVVENRNLFLFDVAGATGLKTGFTSAAGYALAASASREGRGLIAVVLGARDDRERRDVAARLIEHGFDRTQFLALEQSVTLRTSAGPVRFATDGTRLTVPVGVAAAIAWPSTLRPDHAPSSVPVRVSDTPVGLTEVIRLDGRRPDRGHGLGHALVDGVYGAVRHHGLSGALR
jgi:serine-type D-Ala-D-Ala carboxypeptidase (penicillin-binding protein 5/6)